ncbi:MAG TPA: selenocysteine-specific translation elongation factor [Gemmatimonadaceae bacterium]|jgi:selenocysteine-specific elongation factor
MILGTAGHIDHGKTTLVHALTGVDTDRLPEEKKRGITIELGFAPLEIDGVGTIGVIDVPGHEAFVRTMVAGATGIDLALLVVAADEGVMPQTREHLAILELLGVNRGVIALTKSDLADADWLALVEEDVRDASARALPDAQIIPVSATTGAGIDMLRAELGRLATSLPKRSVDDLFRLPVDRVFTIKGTGTVVTGTVWSGRVERDALVRILPGDGSARVRGIQTHSAQRDDAGPGARTAIALAGLHVEDIPRGSTIATDKNWHATTLIRADITLVPGADVAVRPRTWFRLHVGTSEVGARIVTRAASVDDPFGARIVLDQPVVLRGGDRFVLRTSAPLNTIAGGVVVDPYAPRRAAIWPAGLTTVERLVRVVVESGGQGIDPSVLPVRLGLPPDACRAVQTDAVTSGSITGLGGRLMSSERIAELRQRLRTEVDAFHAASPLEPGISTQLLRTRLAADQHVIDALIAAEIDAGVVATHGGALARAGRTPNLSAQDSATVDSILSTLRDAGVEPPSAAELSTQLASPIDALLRFLERRGDVIQTEEGRYYTIDNLKLLVDRLRQVLTTNLAATPAEIRDSLGVSRKYLIPFLEYCDRAGYTNRQATGRVWRTET